MEKQRFLLVDGIRGLAIVNMVIFHFLYDVYIIYGRNPYWYSQPVVHIWQQAICWTFIFVAGFVWQMGQKNNFRRGVFFNVCGAAISLITWIAIPEEAIWFGILNFMGCAVLLMIPLHKLICRSRSTFRCRLVCTVCEMAASFVLFMLLKHIQWGYLGIGGIKLFTLPEWLYQIKILTPFGFPYPGFVSSDYFPVLPWMLLFLTGYFSFLAVRKCELWNRIAYKRIPLLSTIGQKSIWIYLVHQPVCMLISMLFLE